MTILKKVDGHSELLEDALFDLVRFGTIVVSDQKLMRWTDTKRVTPRMWKYVHQLFDEVIEAADEHNSGYRLYVGEGADTYSFLIWDRGEKEGIADSAWWQPVEALEQPKARKKTRRGGTAAVEAVED